MSYPFQFLLGRLETQAGGGSQVGGSGFQFLLGRLETPAPAAGIATILRFQFLLGRLEQHPAGEKGESRFNSS